VAELKPPKKGNDSRRPKWQQERGVRYGNNRKFYARLKVALKKSERAKGKNQSDEE
jgi:hypothetical protein